MEVPSFWKLGRCLPGQRRAALHWNEFFESVVQTMGFIGFEPMPTVFCHSDRRIFLTIHVDDLLVIGSEFDCGWFLKELSVHFNLKSNGPFRCDQPAEVQYLKKIGTKNNVADLNTKNLSVARRRYLFGLCGLSEDQKKIVISNTTDIHFGNPSIVQRIALVLAGLPMVEAVSMEDQGAGLWIWTLLAMVGLLTAMLVWMVPGSPDSPGETASQRRRRYMSSELSEVSDPETWMLHNHHSDMEEDEPEREPRGNVPRGDARERTQTYDNRIFLMFTMIVDQSMVNGVVDINLTLNGSWRLRVGRRMMRC